MLGSTQRSIAIAWACPSGLLGLLPSFAGVGRENLSVDPTPAPILGRAQVSRIFSLFILAEVSGFTGHLLNVPEQVR